MKVCSFCLLIVKAAHTLQFAELSCKGKEMSQNLRPGLSSLFLQLQVREELPKLYESSRLRGRSQEQLSVSRHGLVMAAQTHRMLCKAMQDAACTWVGFAAG